MTYLIALIIAIALGAVIALLSFVNIGSGFGEQSAAAKAQQFAQAGSQLEVAMAAYRADNAGSAYTSGDSLETLSGTLSSDGWLKEEPVAPTGQGALAMEQGSTNGGIYLTLANPTEDVCNEINALGNHTVVGTSADLTSIDADDSRLGCENDGGDPASYFAAFKVE